MRQLSFFAESGDRISRPSYPHTPGFKERGGASEAAARTMSPRISGLRAAVLEKLGRHPAGLTADEIADGLGKTELSIRPRVTELQALGKVEPTGERRHNRSGMTASVWRAVTS